MSELCFHYTDASAVKSILENSELWLSDIRFLNDTQEMHDGVAHVLAALAEAVSESDISLDVFCHAKDFLTGAIQHHVSLGIGMEPTFVCSFSKVPDQLSQWRAYGKYAIEFDRSKLSESGRLLHCIYKDSDKASFARDRVNKVVSKLARSIRDNEGVIGPDHTHLLSILVLVASTFKDSHFYEEQEIRYIESLPLPSPILRFRARGDILIPYVSMPIPFSSIRAVHVGPMPNQEIACIAMEALVSAAAQKYSYDNSTSLQAIEVVASKVPYRA